MSGNLPNETDQIRLDAIDDAIEAIRAGEVVVVVDDEDRENEGDFICAAACVTPEIINFMATHGRGLICTPIIEKRAEELGLDLMVSNNTALHETAFTVSIDLIGHGCTTGISAYDRATGIRAMLDPEIKASDFARPGHIFPLRAKTGGVLRRTGHTEAAIDLARLAGFYPAGVLVEILNEDGTMARLPQLYVIAKKFGLRIISIKDLVAYRMRTERIIRKEAEVPVHTQHGRFTVHAFRQITTGDLHLAFCMGAWHESEPVLVRVHSTSETGDVLGFLLGNYGVLLEKSMARIGQEGKGVLLYMRHSEKNDEVLHHLRAMQDLSAEEIHNRALSADMAQRDFGVGAQILRDLGITRLRLMTQSPKRRVGLIGYGLEIVEHVDL